MAVVKIPSPLRRYTEGQNKVESSGHTIAALIDDLENQYPGIKTRLCNEDGEIKRYVNVFVDDEEISTLQGLETPVGPDAKVSIIPAMAGGRNSKGVSIL